MAEETLLDAFVDIHARGAAEAKAIIDESTEHAKKAFGEVADVQDKAAKRAAAAAEKQAKKIAEAQEKAAKRAADTAIREEKRLTAEREKLQKQAELATQRRINAATAAQQKTSSRSIQTASQIGQAFEDAAVGFQLGGAQGALRGAANNVSVLITGLAQAGTLAAVLGTTLAAAAPYIFAIGTAIAFILPSILKWLSNTEEVKEETLDLAEIMNREFKDIELFQGIIDGAHEAIVAITESKDAVKTLLDQMEETDKGTAKLADTLKRLDDASSTQRTRGRVEDLSALLTKKDQTTSTTPEQFASTTKVRDAIRDLQGAEADLKKAQASGIINDAALVRQRDAIRDILDGLEDVVATKAADEKEVKVVTAALKEQESQVSKLADEARQLNAERANQNESGLVAALANEKQLSEELKFQQALGKGLVTAADEFLVKMREEEAEIKKQNDALRAQDDAIANQLATANERQLQLKHEAELTKEIKDVQDELNEAKKQEAKLNEDIAEKRLKNEKQIAEFVKSSDEKVASAQKSLADEREKQATKGIQDRLNKLKKAADEGIGKVTLGDIGQTVFGPDTSKEQAALEKQLKAAEDNADREKIVELQEEVRKAEEDKLKGLIELNEEAKKIEDEAIASRKELQESLDKNTAQAKQLAEQLAINAAGGRTTIPGVTGPAAADTSNEAVLRAAQQGEALRLQDQIRADAVEAAKPQLNPAGLSGFVDDFLLGGAQGGIKGLAPQLQVSLGQAQAEANNRALADNSFRSPSIEKILLDSNSLLKQIATANGITDTQARFT